MMLFFKRMTIVIVSICITFLALEFFARIANKKGILNINLSHYHRISDMSDNFHELIPGAVKKYPDWEVKINQWGFRDYEYPLIKSPDTYRIMVLGDSFTFGFGVNIEDAFPKILEKQLRDRYPDKKIEVWNCGIDGYSTRAEEVLLKERVIKFDPDLVIVAYVLNDLTFGFDGTILSISKRLKLLARHSILYKIIANRANSYALYRKFKQEEHIKFAENKNLKDGLKKRKDFKALAYDPKEMLEQYKDGIYCWEKTKSSLERMLLFAKKHNFEIAIVIFPLFEDLQNYPYLKIHNIVKKYTGGLGYPVLDLYPFYRLEHDRSLWVNAVDPHPNRKANIIAAGALAEFVSILCRENENYKN